MGRSKSLVLLATAVLLAVVAACSNPDIAGQTWKCASDADCGPGFACHASGVCVAADPRDGADTAPTPSDASSADTIQADSAHPDAASDAASDTAGATDAAEADAVATGDAGDTGGADDTVDVRDDVGCADPCPVRDEIRCEDGVVRICVRGPDGCLAWIEPWSCDDGNACTTDGCNTTDGCVNAPIDCDDGDACTTDSCDEVTGECVRGAVDCDDDDACTDDRCDPADGCINAAVDCDDWLACTTDSCDAATGSCVNVAVVCDDGDRCTVDACHGATGQCTFTAVACSDGIACTIDRCDPATGDCVHDASGCPTDEICDTNVDEDQDGLTDCDDVGDCADDPACRPPCDPDALEEDDSVGSATVVAPGASFGGLTVEDGDQDFYAIPLCAGGVLTVTATFSDAAGDIDLHLQDAQGVGRGSSTSITDDETIVYDAPADETLWLRVTMFDQGGCNGYALSFVLDDGCCFCGADEICDPEVGQCVPNPCQSVTNPGCCRGGDAVWCEADRLRAEQCPADVPCGWLEAGGYFACGGSDPVPDGLAEACPALSCATTCRAVDVSCGPHPDCPWIVCGSCDPGQLCSAGTCEDLTPLALTCDAQVMGTNVGGSTLWNAYNCSPYDATGPEVVYALTPETTGPVALAFNRAADAGGVALTGDVEIYVLAPPYGEDDCVPNGFGDSETVVTLTAGVPYYVVIDGFHGATSDYALSVDCENECADPGCGDRTCGPAPGAFCVGYTCGPACGEGAFCAEATGHCEAYPSCEGAVTGGAIPCGAAPVAVNGDTTGQTSSIDTYVGCGGAGYGGGEIGYPFSPTCTGEVTVALSSPVADLAILILEDACRGDRCVGGADRSMGAGDEITTFTAEADRTYYLVVEGWRGDGVDTPSEGPYELTVTCACSCVPDCAGRACGPDPVCGQDCGGCRAGLACDAAGACVPDPCVGFSAEDGCCDGDTLYTCTENGLVADACGADGCGWYDFLGLFGRYECGGSGEDPTGQSPAACDFAACDNATLCASQGWQCGTGCPGEVCGTCGEGYRCLDDKTCALGAYCDGATPCPVGEVCVGNGCVATSCSVDADCAAYGTYFVCADDVCVFACDDDGFEENDVRGSAADIGAGMHEGLVLCEPPGSVEEDWYTLALAQNELLEVDILFSDAVADLDLRLYDANLQVLATSASSSDDETVEYLAAAAGPVWVRVYSAGTASAPYRMRISVTPFECAEDAYEPNSAANGADAAAITVPFSATGLTLCGPHDEEWFTFDLPPNTTFRFDARFLHADGDIDMRLFAAGDLAAALVTGSSSSDDESFEWTTDAAGGTFYLKLWLFSSAVYSQVYDLSITIPACSVDADCDALQACRAGACVDVECLTDGDCANGDRCRGDVCAAPAAGDTCASPVVVAEFPFHRTAVDISLFENDVRFSTNAASCTGYTNAGRDAIHAVTLTAGATLHVTLTASFDAAVYVLRSCATPADAHCVAGADDTLAGDDEVISWTTDSSGTYYVVVDYFAASGGPASGSFDLTIDVTPP